MKRHVAIAFTLASLAFASSPAAAEGVPKVEERAFDRARWSGTFRFAGGAAEDYVNDGEHTKLSQRIRDGKVEQAFIADEGRRLNEWTLSSDGNTLSVKVTVASLKLSHPVVYTLTYRRTP